MHASYDDGEIIPTVELNTTFWSLLFVTVTACVLAGSTFQWVVHRGLLREYNLYNCIVAVATTSALIQCVGTLVLNILAPTVCMGLNVFLLLNWVLMTHSSVTLVSRKLALTFTNTERAWRRLLWINWCMLPLSVLICITWGASHIQNHAFLQTVNRITEPTQIALWGLIEFCLSGAFIVKMWKFHWTPVERHGILVLVLVGCLDIMSVLMNLFVGDLVSTNTKGFVYTLRIRLEVSVLCSMVEFVTSKVQSTGETGSSKAFSDAPIGSIRRPSDVSLPNAYNNNNLDHHHQQQQQQQQEITDDECSSEGEIDQNSKHIGELPEHHQQQETSPDETVAPAEQQPPADGKERNDEEEDIDAGAGGGNDDDVELGRIVARTAPPAVAVVASEQPDGTTAAAVRRYQESINAAKESMSPATADAKRGQRQRLIAEEACPGCRGQQPERTSDPRIEAMARVIASLECPEPSSLGGGGQGGQQPQHSTTSRPSHRPFSGIRQGPSPNVRHQSHSCRETTRTQRHRLPRHFSEPLQGTTTTTSTLSCLHPRPPPVPPPPPGVQRRASADHVVVVRGGGAGSSPTNNATEGSLATMVEETPPRSDLYNSGHHRSAPEDLGLVTQVPWNWQ